MRHLLVDVPRQPHHTPSDELDREDERLDAFVPRDCSEPVDTRSEDVRAIITLAVPTLKTIAIAIDNYQDDYESVIPVIPFPVLRDLALPSRCFPRHDKDSHQKPIFPSLQRLHLFQGTYGASSALLSAAAIAPHLTSLRISGLQEATGLPALLADVCKCNASDNGQSPAEVTHRFKDVRDVIIAAPRHINTGWCGTGAWIHISMVRDFEKMDSLTQSGSGSLRIMFLPEKDGYGEQLREDWLDGMVGGDGCWATAVNEEGMKVAATS